MEAVVSESRGSGACGVESSDPSAFDADSVLFFSHIT